MSALLTLAGSIGAPLVRDILARRIGGRNAELAETVVKAVAERAGLPLEALEGSIAEGGAARTAVADAIMDVNADLAPDLVALHEAELEGKLAIFAAEAREGGFRSAWRPLGMYLTFAFWSWQLIVLHVLNAVFKVALPPAPWEHLLAWTGLYLSLYMGGHTMKAVFAKGGRA